ncbi:MAG: DUF3375 family protein [Verrucomicrobiota bacterium]|nr:DUF3375 family protein [Verrucomicrobiota bacterium]MEC8655603.1 DUF3375 family protein [Verrucomicrobiota bacterium]MEE3061384.1 DUF3375 family protein [Verrucomicrobiota bacterium]
MDEEFLHLFEESPALRLMRGRLGSFVVGFFFKTFKKWGVVEASEEELSATLAEHIEQVRELEDFDAPKRLPQDYLDEWCDERHRYLTKSFSEEREEYVFRLTRHSEKALSWLQDLLAMQQRGYATTESRFNRIMSEMQNLTQGVNADPESRIRELESKRQEIDEQIRRIQETGEAPIFGEDVIRDQVYDLSDLVEHFLSDFRAIEEFFKDHAREISRLYAQGEASKGDIVEHVLDADEELRGCDQGKSYFGFREMMTNPALARKLRNLAEQTTDIARRRGLDPQKTFSNLGDRLFGEAGSAHGAYGRISRKLRQVVGDHSGAGGRAVRDTLSGIRRNAFRLRDQPPEDWDFEIEIRPLFFGLMEAEFWEPKAVEPFALIKKAKTNDSDWMNEILNSVGEPLDLNRYRDRVDEILEQRERASLSEMVECFPLERGVVDVVCYRVIAGEDQRHQIRQGEIVQIDLNRPSQPRFVEVEQLIFQRSSL